MAQTHIHHGSYQQIPPTASPGLLFLHSFLPVLDALEPSGSSSQSLSNFLAPGATFAINSGAAVTAEQVLPMLEMRGKMLARFGHDVHTAWDIAHPDNNGEGETRTVMYESTSFTVFKNDPERAEALVKEFNVIELAAEGGEWKATALRTYMDSSPVTQRAQALRGPKKEE
jgi:hypothetical protein